MKRFARIATIATALCAACLSLCLLAGCGGGNTAGEVGWKTGTAKYENGTMAVELEANPSTGYAWEVAHEGANLTIVAGEFVQDEAEKDAVGVGGVQKYTITAEEDGNAMVTFNHVSPDGKTTETIVSLELTIKDGKFTQVAASE